MYWKQSRSAAKPVAAEEQPAKPGFRALHWKAFGLAASDPKDILFFAAFLPQFISADLPLLGLLSVIIATWAVLDLVCKLFYGLSTHAADRYLRSG